MDVAGGFGDLAFQLSVRFGIPCTVVDPRGGARGSQAARAARVARGERRRDRRRVVARVAAGEAAAAGVVTFAPEKSAARQGFIRRRPCRTNPPRR